MRSAEMGWVVVKQDSHKLQVKLRPRIIGAVNDAGGEPRSILRGKKAQKLLGAPKLPRGLASQNSELKWGKSEDIDDSSHNRLNVALNHPIEDACQHCYI
jgi:hypothetical protein